MHTRTKRKLNEHTATARLIKKDLKAAFSSVKFSPPLELVMPRYRVN